MPPDRTRRSRTRDSTGRYRPQNGEPGGAPNVAGGPPAGAEGPPPVIDPHAVFGAAELAALRPIWDHLDSRKLAKHIANIIYDDNYLVAGRPVSSSARMERFKAASSLVHFIYVNGPDEPMLARLHSLALVKEDGPLFPNLHTLHVNLTNPQDFDYIQLLLQSKVRHIRLFVGNDTPQSAAWDIRFSWFFKQLQTIWPADLHEPTSLNLSGLPAGLSLLPDVARTVRSFPGLQCFAGDGTTLSHDILCAVTRSPNLHDYSLSTDFGIFVRRQWFTTYFAQSCFSTLRKVKLNASLVIIKGILLYLGPPLQDLSIITSDIRFEYAELSSLIPEGAAWLGPNLKKFSLIITETDRDVRNYLQHGREPISISWGTFSSLLRCTSLTDFAFRIQSWNTFDFRDQDLRAVAQSWRSAEAISLEWERQHAQPGFTVSGLTEEGQLTLASLEHVAAHCPRLRSLRLSSLVASGNLSIPRNFPCYPQVLDLDLGYATLPETNGGQQSTTVAVFLYKIWPRIRLHVNQNGRHVVAWSRVADVHIPTLRLSDGIN